MNVNILFLLFIPILSLISCSGADLNITKEKMGDVKLQIDNEWLQEKVGVKFIRLGYSVIGVPGKTYNEVNKEFYKKAPYTTALNSSEKTLLYEVYPDHKVTIRSYDIPVDENILNIDFSFVVDKLMRDDEWISTDCTFQRLIFFYHPKMKKWWGLYYESYKYDLEVLMYDELYKPSNSKEEIDKLMEMPKRELLCQRILDNPVFILPSLKYYEEKLSDIVEDYHLFCWYIERK